MHYTRYLRHGDPRADVAPYERPAKPPCAVEGCSFQVYSRGYCSGHYQRLLRYGDPTAGAPLRRKPGTPVPICSIDDCDRAVKSRGWCSAHYRKWRKYGDPTADHTIRRGPCGVDSCDRPALARGLCQKHYARWKRHGDPNHDWQAARIGKTYKGKNGYVEVYLPDHPNARKNGLVFQHSAVMTEKLGRPLKPGEFVHHINGERDDNRPENLELWTRAHPPGQRVADLVAWARSVVAEYDGLAVD